MNFASIFKNEGRLQINAGYRIHDKGADLNSCGEPSRRCPLLMLWTAPTLRHQKCHRVVA
jgi:hypothetical protein